MFSMKMMGLNVSIRAMNIENNVGIPWAYRKYTRKLFKLEFLFLEILMLYIDPNDSIPPT